LRVAELRRRDGFAAEIGRCLERGVGVHDQRRATIGASGDDANLGAARLGIGIDRRIGTNVSEVDRFRENRFHRARAGIVDVPFDLHVAAEMALEDAFALT
jgi:hypothetical protein